MLQVYKNGLRAVYADVRDQKEEWSQFSTHFLNNPFNVLLPFFRRYSNVSYHVVSANDITPKSIELREIVGLINKFDLLDRTAHRVAVSNKSPYNGGLFWQMYGSQF